MDTALQMEELSMPRELTNDELEHVSAGVIPVLAFIAYNVGLAAGFAFGRWLAHRLN
jgi:lactobin A/cerein 7B family class IIb bacteriocin